MELLTQRFLRGFCSSKVCAYMVLPILGLQALSLSLTVSRNSSRKFWGPLPLKLTADTFPRVILSGVRPRFRSMLRIFALLGQAPKVRQAQNDTGGRSRNPRRLRRRARGVRADLRGAPCSHKSCTNMTKNLVFNTSSVSLWLPPSPQGEGFHTSSFRLQNRYSAESVSFSKPSP